MASSSSLPSSNISYPEDFAVSGTVVVMTSSGEKFKVQSTEVVRQFSETMMQRIHETGSYDDTRLFFPNINGEIKAKMMEYRNKIAARSNLDDEAGNYLNMKSLVDLACQTVTDMIKGKTPEEIHKTFGIKKP